MKILTKKMVGISLLTSFSLGCFGISRTTVELDFIVTKNGLSKIYEIMRGLGYKCRYRFENVSQYISSLKIFGEIDFLYIFRKISSGILKNIVKKYL